MLWKKKEVLFRAFLLLNKVIPFVYFLLITQAGKNESEGGL